MFKFDVVASTVPQPVFELDGVMYLPDYSKKHRWIGPGPTELRTEYTTAELVDLGAEKRIEQLWPRSWTEEVT